MSEHRPDTDPPLPDQNSADQDSADQNSATTEPKDEALRAITADDNFRLVVATTTATVQQAIEVQRVAGGTAKTFAELLTSAVLLRETLSPFHRLQTILRRPDRPGTMVADTHGDGATRGLVTGSHEAEGWNLYQGGQLEVMRTMANGSNYRGVVTVPSGSDAATAFMTYLQQSEQIVSVMAVGTCWRKEQLCAAGGYVVQLLPDTAKEPLQTMTDQLAALPGIDELLGQARGAARQLLDLVLAGTAHAQLDRRAVRFQCQCSLQTVLASIATLSRDELAELAQEPTGLQLSCDYCHTDYQLSRAQLQRVLESKTTNPDQN